MIRLDLKKTLVTATLLIASVAGVNNASATTLSVGSTSVGATLTQAGPSTVNVSIVGSLVSSFEIFASESTGSAIVGVPIDITQQLQSVELFQTSALVSGANATLLDSLTPLATFTNLTAGSLVTSLNSGSNFFTFRAITSSPETYLLSAQVSAVPLPAAAWLFISALLGLGTLGRRRKLHSVAQ